MSRSNASWCAATRRPSSSTFRSSRRNRSRRCAGSTPTTRQADATPVTRLDIYSDIVCPWCYLGAANLLRALSEHGGPHPFAIHWHPFQLDPSIPREGMDRAAYLAAKFGDTGRLAATHARLEEMGRDGGIAFRFDRIARSPNTL